MLVNLAQNAFEAIDEACGGERQIQIWTSRQGDEIVIGVKDSGCGAEADIVGRAFEPHFTTKANGLGMGLNISRTIVQAHGGRLWAEVNAGQGATFAFSLPIEQGTTHDVG